MEPLSSVPLPSENLSRCPLCTGRGRTTILDEADRPGGFLPRLKLHRCARCAGVFLSPRLSAAAMARVEDESEVYRYEPGQIEEIISGPLDGLLGWLEGFQDGRQGTLLDVGCNRGLLLEAAQRRGWSVVGIELSQVAAQRARRDFGVDVRGGLSDLERHRRFDLITLWHVLEHLPDPTHWLSSLRRRLADDGLMAIQVPSFDFYEEFCARDERDSILCSVHNFYFTERNLPPLLQKCGLEPFYVDNSEESLLLTVLCRPRPLSFLQRLRNHLP